MGGQEEPVCLQELPTCTSKLAFMYFFPGQEYTKTKIFFFQSARDIRKMSARRIKNKQTTIRFFTLEN